MPALLHRGEMSPTVEILSHVPTFSSFVYRDRFGPGHRANKAWWDQQLQGRTLYLDRLRLCHASSGYRRSAGCDVEVPPAPPCSWQAAAAAGLLVPQHSGCAEAGQHQQWQHWLRPKRHRLSSAGLWKHDLPSLWACERWIRAPCVHSPGDNAPQPHQRLLQSLTSDVFGGNHSLNMWKKLWTSMATPANCRTPTWKQCFPVSLPLFRGFTWSFIFQKRRDSSRENVNSQFESHMTCREQQLFI